MHKWLLALLITCTSAQAAEQGVKEISSGRLLLSAGEIAVGIGPTPAKNIERVLIIIHGRLRNAETYRQSAEHAAQQAGQSDNTLVLAPQFLNETDIASHPVPDSVLRWHGNDRMAGGLSTAPFTLSSYAALDEIIARLGDRRQFPDVKQIVIAGHSGGAQVVQRYAMLSHPQPALDTAGVKVRYVIVQSRGVSELQSLEVWAGGLARLCQWANACAAGRKLRQTRHRLFTRAAGHRPESPGAG
jgi:pimeloyl-ACP methyl ester carboxylesterase